MVVELPVPSLKSAASPSTVPVPFAALVEVITLSVISVESVPSLTFNEAPSAAALVIAKEAEVLPFTSRAEMPAPFVEASILANGEPPRALLTDSSAVLAPVATEVTEDVPKAVSLSTLLVAVPAMWVLVAPMFAAPEAPELVASMFELPEASLLLNVASSP